MLKKIPQVVTAIDNQFFNKPVTLEEAKRALFSLSANKSPGPDGFQAFFFQKCWDIIGIDLCKAIEASRNVGSILTEINHTFSMLIPKKSNHEGPRDFRPIALCNTIYKILSITLAFRFKSILPKLIYEEQTSFVPGRSILDGITIIQETIHSAKLNKEACMLMKLDIQKAYDMVNWRLLCKTIEAFGFSRQWINISFKCISTPKISLLINGSPEGYFNISIKQGDPISPFLFIIMAEAFGQAITKAQIEGKIKVVTAAENILNVSPTICG